MLASFTPNNFHIMMTTVDDILNSGTKLTPMMEQYFSIKKEHRDVLLLFRMGDFYEVFFDDAERASRLLNITLTHRGKLGDFPIPMAGIPHHAAGAYIDRLTLQGLKVAICEQVEDPREAKGLVKRKLTQIVSPGMPYEVERMPQVEGRYMGCAWQDKSTPAHFFYVLIDFTTGDFFGGKTDHEQELAQKLSLLSPKEFIHYPGQWDEVPAMKAFISDESILKTILGKDLFSAKEGALYIERLVPSFRADKTLNSHSALLPPLAALAFYISSTQGLNEFYHIRPFRLESDRGKLKVTLSTLVGLEILPPTRENYAHSLLGFMDKTQSALGGRELKQLFVSPLRDAEQLKMRHDFVEYFTQNTEKLSEFRTLLSGLRDLERIMAKVSNKKVNAADLLGLSQGIEIYHHIARALRDVPQGIFINFDRKLEKKFLDLRAKIQTFINDEIGAALDKGNLIKAGAHRERDRLSKLAVNSEGELLQMESKLKEKTGITTLKIRSNNINGYYIEVSKSHLKKVPSFFERRQTLVNSERFVTKELSEFEKEVFAAQEKLRRLEDALFNEVVGEVMELSTSILSMAKVLGFLDALLSLSYVSWQEEFVRPKISAKKIMHVEGGVHPLIRSYLKEHFVAHDLNLDEKKYFGLITGPNMAGKTTVMREMSIIQFLAQIGCFVPAKKAELGLCDYLFSRLGASDNILKGQSTFMVEMSEAAEIVRHATDRSLIVIDEIGRGTSTFDGLSLAWSLVEHFVQKVRALTLFSTHYHELTELVDKLPGAKNLTVETIATQGQVEFLYRLLEQSAGQSYGIYVAKLAGLPREILERSEVILHQLEGKEQKMVAPAIQHHHAGLDGQLSFFPETKPPALDPQSQEFQKIKKRLGSLNLMKMTPLEAMNELYQMQNQLQDH